MSFARLAKEIAAKQGIEVAPHACIVCKIPAPDKNEGEGAWIYMSGSIPIGALVCSTGCLSIAIERHNKTGRVDEEEK
jgi:hypothetical protein